MNIGIIIPSHNESRTIGTLVSRLRQLNHEVLVIDDGSRDDTGRIAQTQGAMVLRNERNLGKGAALRRGFAAFINRPLDGIITMDADGQHDPEDIRNFLIAAEHNQPCVVIGNRLAEPKDMPGLRWLTNRFMSYILSLVCQQKIADSQCGFRFISLSIIRKARLRTDNFEIESELLVEASRKGYRILSVPIRTIYGKEKSYVNPFIDTLRFLKFLFRELWTLND